MPVIQNGAIYIQFSESFTDYTGDITRIDDAQRVGEEQRPSTLIAPRPLINLAVEWLLRLPIG